MRSLRRCRVLPCVRPQPIYQVKLFLLLTKYFSPVEKKYFSNWIKIFCQLEKFIKSIVKILCSNDYSIVRKEDVEQVSIVRKEDVEQVGVGGMLLKTIKE